jgi:hypothetical protein
MRVTLDLTRAWRSRWWGYGLGLLLLLWLVWPNDDPPRGVFVCEEDPECAAIVARIERRVDESGRQLEEEAEAIGRRLQVAGPR